MEKLQLNQNLFKLDGTIYMDGQIGRKKYPRDIMKKKMIASQNFIFEADLRKQIKTKFQFYPFEKNRSDQEILKFHSQKIKMKISQNENDLKIEFNEIVKIFNNIAVNDWNDCSIILQDQLLQIRINEQIFEQKYMDDNSLDEQIIENCYLILGNKNEDYSFKGLISNICITNQANFDNYINQKTKDAILFEDIIIRPLLNIQQLESFQFFDSYNIATQQLIKTTKKGVKVVLCHDMKGGYLEDHFVYGYTKKKNAFRFCYWHLIDIFIYFSHNFITIPPVSYTNVCHKYGVRCLGTIITEGKEGEINNQIILEGLDGNRYFYADKLVQICQYYKFDGYLVNIESNVQNAEDLKNWISYLTEKLHQIGCISIFYDSIVENGIVSWQSQLNYRNEMFLHTSDYFFTDYKWQEKTLQDSMKNAKNDAHKILTGIDIFGRGSYMGGQWNTYLGVQKCLQYNSGIALFAPGWTYECNNGEQSNQKFTRNQEKFWLGMEYQEFYDQSKDNQWKNEIQGGQGWQTYYDDELSSYVGVTSSDFCVRFIKADIHNLIGNSCDFWSLVFEGEVMGTGPNFADPYLVRMELLDGMGNVICWIDSFQNKISFEKVIFRSNLTTDHWVNYQLKINSNQIQQKEKIHSVRFVQIGKDTEYWAGHYGARFTRESLNLISYNKNKDISSQLKKISFKELPIHTNFNIGNSKQYFVDGEPQLKDPKLFYNSLNDHDFLFPYQTKQIKQFNNDICTSHFQMTINEEAGWNGGNSININMNNSQVMYLKMAKLDIMVDREIFCDINVYDCNDLQLQIILTLKNKVYVDMDLLRILDFKNKWKSYKFQKSVENIQVKSVHLKISGAQTKLILGGFSFYDESFKQIIKQIKLDDIQIKSIHARESPKSIKKIFKQYVTIDLELDYNEEQIKLIKYFRIFCDDKWILNSSSTKFRLQDVVKQGQDISLKIQIMLKNGFHQRLQDQKIYIIKHSQILKLISYKY